MSELDTEINPKLKRRISRVKFTNGYTFSIEKHPLAEKIEQERKELRNSTCKFTTPPKVWSKHSTSRIINDLLKESQMDLPPPECEQPRRRRYGTSS